MAQEIEFLHQQLMLYRTGGRSRKCSRKCKFIPKSFDSFNSINVSKSLLFICVMSNCRCTSEFRTFFDMPILQIVAFNIADLYA